MPRAHCLPDNELQSWGSFLISPHEGGSRARTCTGHTTACVFFQNRSLSPPQNISEDAGPHGLCIAGTIVGPALHETPSVLAETTHSALCVATQMHASQGEPSLCDSSDPLERPAVAQAGHDYGYESQKEGCLDRSESELALLPGVFAHTRNLFW